MNNHRVNFAMMFRLTVITVTMGGGGGECSGRLASLVAAGVQETLAGWSSH